MIWYLKFNNCMLMDYRAQKSSALLYTYNIIILCT